MCKEYTVDHCSALVLSKQVFNSVNCTMPTVLIVLYQLLMYFITCSAMILDADWSIGVRSGAVHPLQIQYHPQSSISHSAPPRGIWMTSGGYQAVSHFPTGRN